MFDLTDDIISPRLQDAFPIRARVCWHTSITAFTGISSSDFPENPCLERSNHSPIKGPDAASTADWILACVGHHEWENLSPRHLKYLYLPLGNEGEGCQPSGTSYTIDGALLGGDIY